MKSALAGPIETRILTLRGLRVMLSPHLAELYAVETRSLHQAVKRNADRFPSDFMFRLTAEEAANLRSQSVMSSWGGHRRPPYAFVRLRAALAEHRDLVRRLDELEARYDLQFKGVFDAIRALMAPPQKPPKRIGFRAVRETN